MTRLPSSAAAAVLLLALGACDNEATVSFTTGELEVQISSTEAMLPTVFRSPDGTITRIPCGPMGMCPTGGSVAVTCVADACDPAEQTVSVPVGGVVDISELGADLEGLFQKVDAIEVTDVSYVVMNNTLTIDIGAIDVFWGPEAAVDVGPSTPHLAAVAPIAARTTPAAAADLDPSGVASLSDHLVAVGRMRLFAQTRVDLAPGGPYPEGDLRLFVTMSLRASGQLIE